MQTTLYGPDPVTNYVYMAGIFPLVQRPFVKPQQYLAPGKTNVCLALNASGPADLSTTRQGMPR